MNAQRISHPDKAQAARQLASKLEQYANQDCQIVAVSESALPTARFLANELHGHLSFVPSQIIYSPSDTKKQIGSVSFQCTIINELCRDIPQDYLYHQTQQCRAELLAKYPEYHDTVAPSLRNKIVILVDDATETSYEVLASLKTVQKHQPDQIVVAILSITPEASQDISREADAIFFIHVVSPEIIQHEMFQSEA